MSLWERAGKYVERPVPKKDIPMDGSLRELAERAHRNTWGKGKEERDGEECVGDDAG
jgi:hypothetical protein